MELIVARKCESKRTRMFVSMAQTKIIIAWGPLNKKILNRKQLKNGWNEHS